MVTIRVKNAIVPYKITLLSNTGFAVLAIDLVLVPYKITLLSNGWLDHEPVNGSFSTL